MKIETSSDIVLDIASRKPELKAALMAVFPRVFEEQKPFCSIGSLFLRKDYPNCIYAVIKSGGEIVILNIVHSSTWAVKKRIGINSLEDNSQKSITVAEFKALTGYNDLSNFIPLDKNNNARIRAILMAGVASGLL